MNSADPKPRTTRGLSGSLIPNRIEEREALDASKITTRKRNGRDDFRIRGRRTNTKSKTTGVRGATFSAPAYAR